MDLNLVGAFTIFINRIGDCLSIMAKGLVKLLEFTITHSIRAVLFVAASHNYFRTPKRCPKITDEILLKSARQLSAMIRKREITSEAVVRSYITRMEAVNPILNAIVVNRFDEAIKNAKEVDNMLLTTTLTTGDLEIKYPLLGVPLTIKESIAVEGYSNAAGLFHPEPRIAKKDATVVKLCKEAGAIPVALTNTPEMCSYFETYNKITGYSNNPYDSRKTCGGSSGGEGAILASAASVIGLGSDLYGSIRLPGHFCGIWGHKATANVIPYEGHYPSCENNPLWGRCFTMGPMTRYATDLSLLMQVIRNKPPSDLNSIKANIEDIAFYYMENDGGSFMSHSVDREIVLAMRKLVKHFSQKSVCKQINIESFKTIAGYTFPVLTELMNQIETPVVNGNLWKEWLRYLTCRSNYTLLTVSSSIVKSITKSHSAELLNRCFNEIFKTKAEICQILGQNGVLLFPTHPTPASFHNQTFGKLHDYTYTGMFNMLELPVTQCPIGLNSQGLPIGIQVIAASNNDDLTIAVAEEIEKAFGGWIPPLSD